MAAWTAIFLGSVAVAETPPAEAPEAAVEEEALVEAEAPADLTSTSYGETIEATAETETDSVIASAAAEGEVSAGGEMMEAEMAPEDAPESE